jgi:hypothetical protein
MFTSSGPLKSFAPNKLDKLNKLNPKFPRSMIRLKKIALLASNFFVQSSKPTSKRTILTDSGFQLAIYILDQEVAIYESLLIKRIMYVLFIKQSLTFILEAMFETVN